MFSSLFGGGSATKESEPIRVVQKKEPRERERKLPAKPPERPPNSLEAAMQMILKDQYSRLPIARCACESRKQVVDAIAKSVCLTHEFEQMLAAFPKRCVLANIEVRVGNGGKFSVADLRKRVWAELEPTIPACTFGRLDVTDWNVLALKPREMQEVGGAKIAKHLQHVGAVWTTIVEMMRTDFFGKVEWHPDDPTVTRYRFNRQVIIHEKTSDFVKRHERSTTKRTEDRTRGVWEETRQTKVVIETGRDYYLGRRHGKHEHHAYEAEPHRLPARCVEQPQWVQEAIAWVPSPLSEHLFVVAGEMGRETIVERDLSEERWSESEEKVEGITTEIIAEGRLYSPGLCLGDVCFIGWSQRDLSQKNN